ncbi:MAG: hypothetical protein U0Q11_11595 [Vicinamibacterales bacterium]
MSTQSSWRYCQKCHAVFYNGYPEKGNCSAGGGHEAKGFNFALPYEVDAAGHNQEGWRYCRKCHVMFYDGHPEKGTCVSGGGHEAQGFNFALPHDIAATGTAQDGWRYCQKCHAMFYDGYSDKGRCAAGGGHDADGLRFVLPHDLPGELSYQADLRWPSPSSIGGTASVTVRQDGSYTFRGHLHCAGAEPKTDYSVLCTLIDSQRRPYVFSQKGWVTGLAGTGSRDDDWNLEGKNAEIARCWANIAAGANVDTRKALEVDWNKLWDQAKGAYDAAAAVVKVVGPFV